MMKLAQIMAAVTVATVATTAPALSQDVEGDANSRLMQWARMGAEPGTFWLDSNEDREIIRYTTPRDIRLCLPEAEGVGAAERAIPVTVTWDDKNKGTLYPGNCLFFDARRVSLKPAKDLPSGVTLRGNVETEQALQRGN